MVSKHITKAQIFSQIYFESPSAPSTLLLHRCIELPIGVDDLITIGHLYAVSTDVRLANGHIQGAIDTGTKWTEKNR